MVKRKVVEIIDLTADDTPQEVAKSARVDPLERLEPARYENGKFKIQVDFAYLRTLPASEWPEPRPWATKTVPFGASRSAKEDEEQEENEYQEFLGEVVPEEQKEDFDTLMQGVENAVFGGEWVSTI